MASLSGEGSFISRTWAAGFSAGESDFQGSPAAERLVIDHGMGVNTSEIFEIRRVDSDSFAVERKSPGVDTRTRARR